MRAFMISIIVFTSVIFAEEEPVIERIEIPYGNYVAKVLNDEMVGKTLAAAYGRVVKIQIDPNASADISRIQELVKTAKYVGRVDRRLSGGDPIRGIITFDPSYAANVTFNSFYLIIDGHYFIFDH